MPPLFIRESVDLYNHSWLMQNSKIILYSRSIRIKWNSPRINTRKAEATSKAVEGATGLLRFFPVINEPGSLTTVKLVDLENSLSRALNYVYCSLVLIALCSHFREFIINPPLFAGKRERKQYSSSLNDSVWLWHFIQHDLIPLNWTN